MKPVIHDKNETTATLKRRTLNIISALDTLSRLCASNWNKDINVINTCELLVKEKVKEVFKSLKENKYDL